MIASTSFSQALSYFKDKRLVTIFIFGVASGFPWVMIGSAMSGWLKDEGLSRSSIGLFGLIFAVYSINFLWASIVDRVKLPLLNIWLGQRRSWILFTQVIVAGCCVGFYSLNATTELSSIALLGLILAIASSTQDIAIDGYRIDLIGTENANLMSASSAMATSGWWTGFAGLGSIPFFLADLPNWHWQHIYLVLAAMMAVIALWVLCCKEPATNREIQQAEIEQSFLVSIPQQGARPFFILMSILLVMAMIFYAGIGFPAWPESIIDRDNAAVSMSLLAMTVIIVFARQLQQLHSAIGQHQLQSATTKTTLYHRILARLLVSLVSPIHEFFARNGTRMAISILLFIFLFKIGEAYLGRMSLVFYKEVGFTNTDIAIYSKMINWWVTIIFSLIGSLFTIRYGIIKGLFIGGIAMALSNLMFSVIAIIGPSKGLLAATVIVDGFTGAWGSVAFVALLSVLCNKAFTASQYALMASLGTFARVMLGSYSGVVVDWLDGNWSLFFVLTALMVIPSLLFLYSIRKPLTKLIEQGQTEKA